MRWAAAALLLAACAVHARAGAQGDQTFEGVWEGQINVAAIHGVNDVAAFMPNTQRHVQLRVHGRIVTLRLDGNDIEPPKGFTIEKHDSLALIGSENATFDFIQTWQISLTKTGADTMAGFVWVVTNDKRLRGNADRSRFAWGGVIELTRGRPTPRPRA